MSFTHGRTGYTYYSVNEKINYYTGMLKSGKTADGKPISEAQEDYARGRLSVLQGLRSRSFAEPTMIVTDDKHFGNAISKPRACVIVGVDKKNRLLAAPVYKRTVKAVILDNDYNRQVEPWERPIDRSDVYEIKYIDGLKPLTENDKGKIKVVRAKNNSDLLGHCLQRLQCRTPLTRCRAFAYERGSGAYYAGRIAMTVNLPSAFCAFAIIRNVGYKVNRFSQVCKIDLEIQKAVRKWRKLFWVFLCMARFHLCFAFRCIAAYVPFGTSWQNGVSGSGIKIESALSKGVVYDAD